MKQQKYNYWLKPVKFQQENLQDMYPQNCHMFYYQNAILMITWSNNNIWIYVNTINIDNSTRYEYR